MNDLSTKSDEELAAEVRAAADVIHANCVELRSRGYQVWASRVHGSPERYDDRYEHYWPGVVYAYGFRKNAVVVPEKEL